MYDLRPIYRPRKINNATTGAVLDAGVAAIGAAIANRDDDPRTRNRRNLKAAIGTDSNYGLGNTYLTFGLGLGFGRA